MNEINKVFNDYTRKYDLCNDKIKLKYDHCKRVMILSKEIAKSINLNKKDIEIAKIIGLFHDIGRFEQILRYDTFNDEKSIDHADLGVDILNNELIDKIIDDEYYKKVITTAIYNHNKYTINTNIDNYMMLMSKIIRDADKIDIIKNCGNSINDDDKVNDKTFNYLYNHQMVKNTDVTNSYDMVLRYLSFIYDLNFLYSYNYILEKKLINKKIELIEQHSKYDCSKLKKELILYLKK